jgi:Spy/CpxP family protein refolding chaperone
MRMLCVVLAVSVAVALWAAPPAIQAQATQRGTGLAERIQDLNLTDAQEAKIADLRKEFRPKVQEAAKEVVAIVREEVEKMQTVLTPQQKQKLQTLREERQEHREDCLAHRIANLRDLDLTDAEMTQIGDIRKEFRPKIEKALEGLKGTLSAEQMKAREEALTTGKTRRQVLEALKLTPPQKEKVETVGKEVAGLVREELDKIRDVLTKGQQEKLQDLKEERHEHVRDRMAHRIANLKDLNLTDEQKTKLADIRKEYRPKVHEAGNKLRAAVREEVEKILAVIRG